MWHYWPKLATTLADTGFCGVAQMAKRWPNGHTFGPLAPIWPKVRTKKAAERDAAAQLW